jgi:HAE1 family hydrophobic/amphiphilic exporter-1
VEDAISTISDLETLTSFSRENVSIVIAEFDYEVDPDLAAIDVKDKVDAIRADLPDEADPPTIQKLDINAMPIMDLALSGSQSLDALYDFADQIIAERLSRVSGVASVSITGGRQREVHVLAHPDRLRAYGLAITDLAQLVAAKNMNVPAGRITEPHAEYAVRVVGEYASVSEIASLPIPLPEGGRIRLADVATVEMGLTDVRELARYQGQPAVSISIQKQSDANTVATAAGVMEVLDELERQVPEGADLVVATDRSEFIRDAIQDILKNILIGILLTTGVLFLFLHSWRGTIIAAVAMPATIVATFLALDQMGFTINTLTLMALGITVGILVTNTIVVLENIYRYLDKGADPHEAAEEGTTEVAIAVAASALTNLVVFTPIAFMQGIIGQFFFAFGLTVVFATLASVLISFTLAPLLAARLLRTGETEKVEKNWLGFLWRPFDAGYASLEEDYRRILSWALRRPRNGWAVVGGTGVLVALAILVQANFVGGEFFPSQDEGMAQVALELPPGTPVERMETVVDRAEGLLREIPEITEVLTTIGQGSGGFFSGGADVNQAYLQLTLESEEHTETFLPRIRELLAAIPDAEVTVTLTQTMGGGGESPLQVLVKGPDQSRLEEVATRATALVEDIPGLVDVRNSLDDPRPEVVFHPDREVMSEYGLTVAQVGGALRTYIEGATPAVYREEGEERDIRVRLEPGSRDRAEELTDMQIRTRDDPGERPGRGGPGGG